MPLTKLFEDGGALSVSMTIENLAHHPMDLVYGCRLNFKPATNGEIVQADAALSRVSRRDSDGMTHMIQKHTDGSSDYMGYDAAELDHTVRWILIHQDQQVIGMALPSTCDPEGYTSERKKGNVRAIPPLGKATFSVRTGYLDSDQTRDMERRIRSM